MTCWSPYQRHAPVCGGLLCTDRWRSTSALELSGTGTLNTTGTGMPTPYTTWPPCKPRLLTMLSPARAGIVLSFVVADDRPTPASTAVDFVLGSGQWLTCTGAQSLSGA